MGNEVYRVNTNQDSEHLNLLSIFHFVVAGIVALFSLFPILHLVIGIAIVTGSLGDGNQSNPPPALVGWIFIVIPAGIIMCGLALATCIGVAGRRLGQYHSYTFCLVIAAIECTFMPFGTVLGVLTIIVLMRPSVKVLFGVGEGTGP